MSVRRFAIPCLVFSILVGDLHAETINEIAQSSIRTPEQHSGLSQMDAIHVEWRPSVDGMSRFQAKIPQSGIEDALKYRDTNSLFYTTQWLDEGILITERANARFHLNLDAENSVFTYARPLTKNMSSVLGYRENAKSSGATLGIKYRFVSGLRSLSEVSAEVRQQDLRITYAKTHLNTVESFETSASLSSASQRFGRPSLQIGRRWFDVWGDTNFTVSAFLDGRTALVYSAIEKPMGLMKMSLGLNRSLSGEDVSEIQLGIKLNLGRSTEFHGVYGKVYSNLMDGLSLSKYRRRELPNLWRQHLSVK